MAGRHMVVFLAAFLVLAGLAAPGPALAQTEVQDAVKPAPPTFTRRPSALTNRTTATFEFEASTPGARFQCRLNRTVYSACSSPKTYRNLRSRFHELRVRVVAPAGGLVSDPAVHQWRVDAIRPTIEKTSFTYTRDRTKLRGAWVPADRGSGVANSDARYRRADAAGVLGPWRRPSSWQRTRSTSLLLRRVLPGRKYCFAVRSRDRAGNRSPWSPRRCLISRGEVRTTSEGFRYVAGKSRVFGASGTLRTYSVEAQPGTNVNIHRFTDQADAILGASKGWPRGSDVRFQRVAPRDARIRVLLATPATVDRYCAGIANTGGYFSCWNGRFAMINMNRWHDGADKFTGTLRQYRGYLLNHEVGHALGHRHRGCPGAGRLAPVMMQQSKGTAPCKPNPWPYP